MRKPLAAARKFLFGCLILLVSKLAIAQTATNTAGPGDASFDVEVERDELAVSCPDLPWFRARITSHINTALHAGRFKITLTRQGEAWHARIQRWEPSRGSPAAERVLRDRSTACEPLAEAVALTVAILAEDFAQHAEARPAATPNSDSNQKPLLRSESTASAAADEKSDAKVWVGAGGGAAMSFISPIAPVLGFGVALDSKSVRLGLRVMLTTEQKFELDPGRVVVQAWLATVFSCLRVSRENVGAALCAAADGSMLRASAEGFAEGRPSTRKYAGVGLEAQPSWRISEHYRISAALAALVPVTRESFSVTGRGVAYVPPELNWRVLLFSEIGAF